MQATIELPNKAYLLPNAIPNWPPAWWFWLALFALFMILALMVSLGIRHHQQRAYRREAIQQLQDWHELSDQELAEHCLLLIRRCLKTEGHDTLISLPTAKLLPFLDSQIRSRKYAFQHLSEELIELPYRPAGQLSVEKRQNLIATTKFWIRRHRA